MRDRKTTTSVSTCVTGATSLSIAYSLPVRQAGYPATSLNLFIDPARNCGTHVISGHKPRMQQLNKRRPRTRDDSKPTVYSCISFLFISTFVFSICTTCSFIGLRNNEATEMRTRVRNSGTRPDGHRPDEPLCARLLSTQTPATTCIRCTALRFRQCAGSH